MIQLSLDVALPQNMDNVTDVSRDLILTDESSFSTRSLHLELSQIVNDLHVLEVKSFGDKSVIVWMVFSLEAML